MLIITDEIREFRIPAKLNGIWIQLIWNSGPLLYDWESKDPNEKLRM